MVQYELKDFRTWATTNNAVPLDVMEGSLIDNAIYSCKHGIAIVKEKFETTWTSKAVLIFARKNNIPDQWELWEMWDKMKDGAQEW